jgi:monoamine oxidase
MDNTPPNGPPALMAFVVGNKADDLRQLSPAERRARILDALVQTFEQPLLGQPIDFFERDWTAEPWSVGCPTGIFGPNGVTTFGPFLREPFDRVHWSGTETSTAWTGYMSGAVDAGWRTAEETLRALV